MLGSRIVDRLLPALLHPIVTSWRTASDSSWRRLPRPHGEPVVYAAGPEPLRVLLVGGGIAVGYGTVSHDLALAGHIARRVAALTGRGISVDILAGADELISRAPKLLGRVDLAQFDAIVATFGGAEAATFLSVHRWRRQLDTMLDFIETVVPRGVPVVIGAVPLIDNIPGVWGRLTQRRAQQVNDESRRACKRRDTAVFAAINDVAPRFLAAMNRDVYAAWGDSLAPHIAHVLQQTVRGMTFSGAEVVDENARQAALDDLEVLAFGHEEEFARIVQAARERFHVSGARIDVIDHALQRVISAAGMSWQDGPRQGSISDFTISKSELLCIEDAEHDERVAASARGDGGRPLRFYAGYPIEAPDGHRVGTMCITDPRPRSFSPSDGTLLKEFALQAQSYFWRRK